ncbi:hypothetical protein ACFORH_11720 [Amycolatopsis roodepoortensis]|uniref:Uncharacterized protein n=1 Tax=Amycolatopsis roodepoortensis TaxID=700274 RepID=A0ABR9LC25_9PSEU|nr:hypothetical protein [Amycolatopsis roodepoortensis]MBE1577855.1 hypothetical protein [Amycolatopsis roodepoortensis]
MPAGRDKVVQAPAARPARPDKPARRATPPALLRLQAAAGNAAVTRLVGLQRSTCPAPPVAPTGVTPASDPKFGSLKKDVSGQAKAVKAHPPATAEVKKAQDAAVAPADDKEAQAKAAQADKMAAAKPAGFDKAAFVAAVNAAVAKQAPKNLDEADKFASSGKADQIKSEVMGKVTSGKDASAKDVTDRTKEAPDTGKAAEKPVKPLPETPPPPALSAPDPRKATPDKAPPGQTDLRADQCETHGKMAEAGVTDEQLAQSNEPEFTGALAAKREGEQHTAAAPAAVRESEAGTLAAVTGAAQASGQAAMAGMTGARSSAGQRGQAVKSATKAKDEQDRARITAEIKAIFDETKTKVEGVLGALDDQVAKRFETGEAAAKAAFTADHQARMKKYKDERYDGVTGAARWTYDLFAGLPAEANNLFLEAKKVYESKMQGVIGEIADFVGQQLTEAKRLIAEGRERVKQKVDSQSPALRKIAGEAAKEFGSQFDELESSVDEKQQSLVDDLAQKYSEARNAVDEEIKALQAENKGLWDKAKEAVGGAIDTILKLKDMLLGVLSRAANAVGLIIAKPIEFLGNLVNAVKTGVMNFGANIVQHLKDGLKAWLLGNLASAGIEIPETLDAKGILKMIMSLLGLTWASVRARILRFIPEPVLAKLEQTFEVVKILITEGVPGLWRWVVEKLGDLKELVLGQIKEFVIEKIVKAGITWIISMLNPAAAFIKACKAIYDIVMFFVDKAARVKEFVSSVLDSVESIARGGAGAVAGLIERTLAKALPMVLGFLASLLGLGGISEKIKSILEKVQAPVGKVIDTVVGTIVKAGKKIWTKLKGTGAKVVEGAKSLKDALFAKLKKKTAVTMKGNSHSLYMEVRGGRPVLMMASDADPLVDKIDRALEHDMIKSRPAVGTQISQMRGIVVGHETKLKDALATNAKEEIQNAEAQIWQERRLIASTLQAIGHEIDLDMLKESTYVLGGEVRSEFRTDGKFRPTFYGGFNGPAKLKRQSELSRLMSQKLREATRWRHDPVFTMSTSYICPGKDYKTPHLVPGIGNTAINLDHKEPSVIKHWNATGRKSDQDARTKFFNDLENLHGMCGTCNKSNGAAESGTGIWTIQPGFKGPDGT